MIDSKWMTIALVGIITAIMAMVAVSEWSKYSCRAEVGKGNRTALEIVEICR